MEMRDDVKAHFDVSRYVHELVRRNRLALREKFYPCTCSGPENLEGVVQELVRHGAFVCVDDTAPGVIVQRSGGWMMQRHATVWLVKRYRLNDAKARAVAMEVCRALMRQLCSRLVLDEDVLKGALVFLDTERITTFDLGAHFIPAATGVSFMFAWEEPTDLRYNAEEWMV